MTRTIWSILVLAMAVALLNPVAAEANLLINPGFEDPVLPGGDVPGAVGWADFGAAFTIKLASRSGDNAFKTFGSPSGIFQQFPAAEGQPWQGSAWGLNPSFDALSGAQAGFINIEWRDAGDNLIDFLSTEVVNASTPQGDSAADYVFATVSGIAPPGTAFARFVVLTGAFAGPGGGAVFFDDASFVLIPEPASVLLALVGMVGILGLGARRRK